jgi:hypothetical protein
VGVCHGDAASSGGPGAPPCTIDIPGNHRQSRVSRAGLRVLRLGVQRRPHRGRPGRLVCSWTNGAPPLAIGWTRGRVPLAARPGGFPQTRQVRSYGSLLGTTIRLARRRGCPIWNTPPRARRCEYTLDLRRAWTERGVHGPRPGNARSTPRTSSRTQAVAGRDSSASPDPRFCSADVAAHRRRTRSLRHEHRRGIERGSPSGVSPV